MTTKDLQIRGMGQKRSRVLSFIQISPIVDFHYRNHSFVPASSSASGDPSPSYAHFARYARSALRQPQDDKCLMHPVHPQQHLPQRVTASEHEKRGDQHNDQDHDP